MNQSRGDGNKDVSLSDLQNLWMRFMNYEASCLKADLVAGMVPVGSKRWVSISEPCETIVSQGDRLLMLEADIDRLVARMMSTQSLQYGWPLVALETRDGLKVAPLFVLDIAPPPYPANSICVFGDPVINPAVVRSLLTNSGDINFLRNQLGDGIPTTGAVAVERYLADVCQVLGLESQELDPYALNRDVPHMQGVYNSAVVVIVESLPTVRPIIEELRLMADRDDWMDSSAAVLFGLEKPPIEGRTNMPAMPWSTEEAFEEGLQMVRHNSITVFNMSQRDVIDQLYASIVSNAWVDGDSVLVVTDDEKRHSELSKLGRDIHNGMLVRTCCDADLEINPTYQGISLSDLSVKLIDEIEATLPSLPTVLAHIDRDLELVEEFRRVAIAGGKRRASLLKQKQEWEMKRVELAKRIWRGGLQSTNLDPTELGQEIKALQRSWFCAGVRSTALLRRLKAKKSATLQDVLDWCLASLAIKNVDADLLELRDSDKYNIDAANYRWASSCIGYVSAKVSERLSRGIPALENLSTTRARDLQTRRAVSDAVEYLRCWATDYDSANAYFRLEPNIFDILILDNAHRFNLAWALPLAYRARRVVVVGDMSAATHNVFLDSEQLRGLANRYQFEQETMIERCLDYSVSNIYAAFSHT